jgi:hypothetical protein
MAVTYMEWLGQVTPLGSDVLRGKRAIFSAYGNVLEELRRADYFDEEKNIPYICTRKDVFFYYSCEHG